MNYLREYDSTNFVTGLRAVAILLVFLIHSGGGGLREMEGLWNLFVDWAKNGVAMFFVISGYTIFFQLYERDYSLKYFLAQRVGRIVIPYWPLLLVLLVSGVFGIQIGANPWGNGAIGAEISLVNWILHASFLTFWSADYSNTIIGVEWTLGIEFFYYTLLGLLFGFFRYKSLKYVILIIFSLILLELADFGRYLIEANKVKNYLDIHWSPLMYGYMFMLGGSGYFIRKSLISSIDTIRLIVLSDIVFLVVLLLFFLNLNMQYQSNLQWFFSLVTFFLVVFTQDNSVFGRFLTSKLFIFIGSISFSMYLWHFLIINTPFLIIPGLSQFKSFWYYLLMTIVVSSIWYYYFEVKIYKEFKVRVFKKYG